MRENKLKNEGIMSQGYGVISKLVMRDKDLSIEAKAIYSYLVSYAGAGDTSYPSVKLMCSDLGIGVNRFYRHRKMLEDKGYIVINRHRNEKGWENNIYTLPTKPCIRFEDIQNEDIQNEDIQNEDTNNNNSNNNNSNNNKDNIPYVEIITYLNEKASRDFRNVESNKRLIRARWNEGYRLDDFKKVVDNKVTTWKGTKWEQYLQPSTLFGNKFDGYLNEKVKGTKQDNELVFGEYT